MARSKLCGNSRQHRALFRYRAHVRADSTERQGGNSKMQKYRCGCTTVARLNGKPTAISAVWNSRRRFHHGDN
jgi:hypothetical protein